MNMMKWMALAFAALFAYAVNIGPAMADDDDHHDKYEQHESKHGHDKKHESKHDDEGDNDYKNKHDDESKDAGNKQHNSASSTGAQGTVNNNGAGVNVNLSKWWPF